MNNKALIVFALSGMVVCLIVGFGLGLNIANKACEEDFAALNNLDRVQNLCAMRHTGNKRVDFIVNSVRAETCHEMLHR